MRTKDFIEALNVLETDRGISKTIVLDALKEALEKSYKRIYCEGEADVRAEINEEKGKIRLYLVKTIVETVEEGMEDLQIALKDMPVTRKKYGIGDSYEIEVDPNIFSRLAASQTKQILRQKIREVEKESLYEEYASKKDELITGVVDRVEERFTIINIGKTGALLALNQQIPNEKLVEGQYLKVYVCSVEKGTKGAQILVSRSDPGLVKRLFEAEVPEIFEGVVEIKSVSRDVGERCKIAVYTSHPDIDAVGACVGNRGSRVQAVVNELHGEKIDIVEWSANPEIFIANALSPAKVTKVSVNEENHSAQVIVPDNQLSLAIGKRGQNARLSVALTGWKIDIKSLTDAVNDGLMKEFEEKEVEPMIEVENEIVEEVIEKVEDTIEEVIVEQTPVDLPVEEKVRVSKPKEEKVDLSGLLAVVRKEKAKVEKAKKGPKTFKKGSKDDEDYFYEPKDRNVTAEPKKVIPAVPVVEEEEIELEDDILRRYAEDIDYDEYDKYYDED